MTIDMKEVIRVPWRRGITKSKFFYDYGAEAIRNKFTFNGSYIGPDLSDRGFLEEALIHIIAFSRNETITDNFTVNILEKPSPWGTASKVPYSFAFSVKDLLGIKDTDSLENLKFDWNGIDTSMLFNFLRKNT